MNEHTPGPWTISGLPDNVPEAINADGPANICRVPRDAENYKANARLIAAAPDLWVVCKLVERLALHLDDDCPSVQAAKTAVNKLACAAIAKAEKGETA